jgi:hypothetical protein
MKEEKIVSWRIGITWSDGKKEGLAGCLPEHIEEELLRYFQELEELRAEHDAEMREENYQFEEQEEKQL